MQEALAFYQSIELALVDLTRQIDSLKEVRIHLLEVSSGALEQSAVARVINSKVWPNHPSIKLALNFLSAFDFRINLNA